MKILKKMGETSVTRHHPLGTASTYQLEAKIILPT
jgi:hypothetical protein